MMQKKVITPVEATELNYIVYTPANKTEKELSNLPLLVYLHGAGERGKNVDHLYRHAIPKLVESGREYEAIILCPQCPTDGVWDNYVKKLKALIDAIVETYGVQKDRISLTGSSMGGYGTWMTALTYRNFFAAIGPIAGGGMSWRVGTLAKTPVYVLHGDKDTTVPITCSELMVNALKNAGGNVRYKVLVGFEHNDGINEAYEIPTLSNGCFHSVERTLKECLTFVKNGFNKLKNGSNPKIGDEPLFFRYCISILHNTYKEIVKNLRGFFFFST